ncbi:MAG: alpha/beta hydrolase [Cyanobacteria bacterium]|nr:alpha/beta hydrolase [Cyanobacteriota bacterium]
MTATIASVSLKPNRKNQRRRLLNLAVFFVCVLYLAMSPPVFYTLLEFAPVKCAANEYPKCDSSFIREDVWFKTKTGVNLHGWYLPRRNSKKTAIIHHGQGGNVALYSDTALTLVQSGCSVFLYDYEGYGASEGSPSNEGLRVDSEAAYDYIVNERKVDPSNIVHCGVSLGSGPACELARRKPCAGIILLSPYLSLRSIAQRFLPFLRLYPAFTYPQPDFGARVLFDTKLPILMIHAEGDPLLPISSAEELSNRALGPKTFIRVPGAVHVGGLSLRQGRYGDTSAIDICKTFVKSLN